MSTWSYEQRIAFQALCHTPIMQEALAELERRCQVTPLPLAQGYDALVLAAAEHHRKSGQAEVLGFIKEMQRERKEVKPLPPPNTAEALATTKPQP